jgi:hypothetical protein
MDSVMSRAYNAISGSRASGVRQGDIKLFESILLPGLNDAVHIAIPPGMCRLYPLSQVLSLFSSQSRCLNSVRSAVNMGASV